MNIVKLSYCCTF